MTCLAMPPVLLCSGFFVILVGAVFPGLWCLRYSGPGQFLVLPASLALSPAILSG